MEGGGLNKSGGSPSPEEETAAPRRAAAAAYYECSFCKRGFTNAQALGGHMNIHRKDRGGGGGGKSSASRGAAPPSAGGQQDGGDQVHLGLTLGRGSREDVDLELRLGRHYPCN